MRKALNRNLLLGRRHSESLLGERRALREVGVRGWTRRDMISLRDGMGSAWAGKFFRRRRRRRRRRRPPGGGGGKIAKTLGFLKKMCEHMEKHIYTVKSENRVFGN